MHKLIVITNGNYFSRVILEPMFRRYQRNIKKVIVITGDYNGRGGINALWNVGRKTAVPYTLYKVSQIILFKAVSLFFDNAELNVATLASGYGLSVGQSKRVMDRNVHSAVEKIAPDLIVSVSCPQKIPPEILECATFGGINIHSSLLPSYAGIAPYYWVLAEGEEETGVTVHYMTEEFDEGNILSERELAIPPNISAFRLFKMLCELGAEALCEAVERALEGEPGREQNPECGSYRSLPTWKSYRRLKQRGYTIARISEMISTVRCELKSKSSCD